MPSVIRRSFRFVSWIESSLKVIIRVGTLKEVTAQGSGEKEKGGCGTDLERGVWVPGHEILRWRLLCEPKTPPRPQGGGGGLSLCFPLRTIVGRVVRGRRGNP